MHRAQVYILVQYLYTYYINIYTSIYIHNILRDYKDQSPRSGIQSFDFDISSPYQTNMRDTNQPSSELWNDAQHGAREDGGGGVATRQKRTQGEKDAFQSPQMPHTSGYQHGGACDTSVGAKIPTSW